MREAERARARAARRAHDLALKEAVPTSEWGEFCRLQLPSPRLDEEDDAEWNAPAAEDGQPHSVEYEVMHNI